MMSEFFKQIEDIFIEIIPIPNIYLKDHYFGYKWQIMAFFDLSKMNFLDSKGTIYHSYETFKSPLDAMLYAEKNINSIKDRLMKTHITDLESFVMPIDVFKKQLRKSGGDIDIITIKQYNDGDFYSDDGDYKAYMIYGDKVFTYFDFASGEITDNEPYDEIRNNKLSKIQLAAQYLGCDVKDFKDVLFVDYPEDK